MTILDCIGTLLPILNAFFINNETRMQFEYTIPFRVRSYEVDQNGRATMPSVCNYFQEAAGVHANHLQFDIEQLRENGMTWVLYKMEVHVDRYPDRWEDVTVKTRPSAGDGLRALRDYELIDHEGNRLAAAVSQWMVLNLKTRRPVRIPQEILKLGLKEPTHIIEPDKKPIAQVGMDSGEETAPVTRAGHHHLDMNGHVNNVTYISWFTGHVPRSVAKTKQCSRFEIQYISECGAGDDIRIAREITEEGEEVTIRQTLYKSAEGKHTPISAAVSRWS
jgi:acyl-ACP thioesterase